MEAPRIEVVVDSRLRVLEASLPPGVADRLREVHEHKNPQHHKLKKMGFKAWKEPPIIRTWAEEHDQSGRCWLTVPRGGMRRLRGVLAEAGLRWAVIDRRTEGDAGVVGMTAPIPPHKLKLWEHQERIVEAVLKRENCVVRSSTGSGKTEALLAAVSRINLPALIVVWESGLMRQWLERIEKELGLSGSDVGVIGGGKFRLRPVTMGMQQSLNAMSEDRWALVERGFGVLGCDELSKFAAATYTKTIDRIPARYRIGMSASEKRKDGKEFLIYDLFGAVAVDVPTAEMVGKGIVHDVEVRVVPTAFSAPWYQQTRVEGGVPSFHRLLEEMVKDGRRNALIATVVRECAGADRRVLVFAHRRKHCRRLDSALAGMGLRSGIMTGEDDEEYAATVAGLRSGDRQVGVGTFARIGMGLDLPAVAGGVVATPCHTNRQLFGQVAGRLSRRAEGKSGAMLYYIWDREVHGRVALINLRRWNKTVSVRDGAEWVDVSDYLERMKRDAEEAKRGREAASTNL